MVNRDKIKELAGSADQNFSVMLNKDDHIGRGVSRDVFGIIGSNDAVIKVSNASNVPNNQEWIIWNIIKKIDTGVDPYSFADHVENKGLNIIEKFAECFAISETGRYLIMERLSPIAENSKFNNVMFPDWINDKKIENFGIDSSGNLKMMDYSNHNLEDSLRLNWLPVPALEKYLIS